MNTSDSDKGENGGFCSLLREVITGQKPVDALLEDPEFKRRLRIMCRGFMRDWADAEELFDDVCVKVWHGVANFRPDYTHDYGNFFAWLIVIARRAFLDEARRPKVEVSDERVEDLLFVADPRANIYEQTLNNEREEELRRCIANLPEKERLAATYYVLEGLSSRETAKKLTKARFPCSNVTARKWVEDGLRPNFPIAEGFSLGEVQRKDNKLARARSQGISTLKRAAKPSKKKAAKS